ncbi:MAG: DNA cytosine methyltransferase [Pyrinomonadaceae bacterium]
MEIWSFFSGAMGLDIGLREAGLTPTLAVELDQWCCETIRSNLPELDLVEGDARNLTSAHLRERRHFDDEVFLIVGGPPCQSFSPGGKRAGLSDPRGHLIYEYLRLVDEIRPKFFLLENVANLVTAALCHREIKDRPGKHWSLKKYETSQIVSEDGAPAMLPDELSGSAVRQLLQDVGNLGYSITFGVVNAADYGAAQHRLRFIMLGSKEGPAPELPFPTHGDPSTDLRPFKTVREAIEDLRSSPGSHSSYTPEMMRYFECVPEGGNWRNLPKSLHAEALGGAYNSGGGKTGFFRRLSWDAPAPTIIGRANRKGSAMCHPEYTRPLSVKECARIQGFPDYWKFAGPMNQQYLQVGNAVPVELGRAIGGSIQARATMTRDVMAQAASDRFNEVMLDRAVKRLRASARNKQSRKSLPMTLFDDANLHDQLP